MRRPTTHGLLILIVAFGAIAPLAGTAIAADTPEFEQSLVRTTQGETAEIAVAVPDGTNGTMTIQIGSEEVNFIANATVVNADGDNGVVLQFDTAGAGHKPADSYLSVLGGDELASAEQPSHEFKPDQLLAEGDYELALWSDGEEVDIGTLVMASNETTQGDTTSEAAAGTSFVYEGEQITLDAADGQVVRGETALDAGTSVTVRMRSSGESPFLKSVETTVTEQETFEATFDMSDISEGSGFEVSVRGNGSELASAEGRVGCGSVCPSTASAGSPTTFAPTNDGTDGGLLGGLGALGAMALGAVLAVVGVGVLLGVFRS